jgi:hypothetical protein
MRQSHPCLGSISALNSRPKVAAEAGDDCTRLKRTRDIGLKEQRDQRHGREKEKEAGP